MKILSAEQVRQWDQYIINNEPILSIDLMERAAATCKNWLLENFPDVPGFTIFCGKGNNGGDGLAIARILLEQQYKVTIYILEFGRKGTEDFQTNLARLHQLPEADIHFIQSTENFHPVSKDEIIIDALFGSELNRKLEGVAEKLVEHINNTGCQIISIDIPSGLFTDHSSKGNAAIKATYTLTFQCYKAAFFVAENEAAIGTIQLLNIGLQQKFFTTIANKFELVDIATIDSIYKTRKQFSHKGTFGHALMIAGSYGKMGAAILAAKACLRSGVGLLTCHIPQCGYEILQIAVPESMVETDTNENYNTVIEKDLSKYKAIGIGPGIGIETETIKMMRELFNSTQHPIVIDADALNILSAQKELLTSIPSLSILTPHPKEFERLFGASNNDFERIELAIQKAAQLNCVIILKGHHTFIATATGKSFFNSTGNAGMATGGSGDVLTGILTGLLAQGYNSADAAILGVYLHGLAGDLAAKELSMEAMLAGDIVEYIGKAFLTIS